MLKNKGFTLVELLAVVTILGVIILIAFPYANNLLKKSKDNEYSRFLDDVYLATEAYLVDNSDDYSTLSNVGGTEYIHLKKVVENGYLRSTTVNPKTNEKIDLNTSVKVTLNDDKSYSYEYMDKNYDINAYVQNGLILHYDGYNEPILENGTLLWKDLSGNNNDGIMNGFTTEYWSNNGIIFDGVNDYIDTNLSLQQIFPASSGDITLSATFQLVSVKGSNYTGIIFGEGYYEGLAIYFSETTLGAIVRIGTPTDSLKRYMVNYELGKKYKIDIVVSRSSNETKIYIDGVNVYSGTSVSGTAYKFSSYINTIKISSNKILSGSSTPQNPNQIFYSGAIYNRALTEEEIVHNYEIDKQRFGM